MSSETSNHHGNHKRGWYTTDNQQVYDTTGHTKPSNYASERVPEAWTRGQMIAIEPATERGRNRIYKANEEDVDAEANQFIKLEHTKFIWEN